MLAPAMSSLVALSFALVSAWVVLPVHSTNPPPQDPTLLRLSQSIAHAVHDAVGEDVRMASREERDERCPQEDGSCPNELAALLGVDRAVVLVLDAKFASLQLRVFHGRIGVEREGTIPCRWANGAVACEVDKIAPIFAGESGPNPLKEGEVEAAFNALRPRLDKCRANEAAPPEAWVSFKVRPDGRVYDVRIDPRELLEHKGFECIATTMESMSVRRFSGAPQPFRFSLLPEPAKSEKPEKAPAKKKPKKAHAK